MPRLSKPSSPPAALSGWAVARRRFCALLTVLALGAASAQVAHAAVTSAGNTDSAATPMGSSTRSLDKALGGDLTTGDRNLDLLLESQRQGGDKLDEAPVSRPMPDRPAGGRGALPPLPEALPATPPRPPEMSDAARRFESPLLLPERGQPANLGSPSPKATRDWGGGTGQATGGGGGSAAAGGSGGSIYGDTTRLRSAVRPLHEWINDGVDFIKDHLIGILLGAGAIGLLAMGLKAYSRRI